MTNNVSLLDIPLKNAGQTRIILSYLYTTSPKISLGFASGSLPTNWKQILMPQILAKSSKSLIIWWEKQGNRLTRRPTTVVNFFQPCWSWNVQNPVFFTCFIFGRHFRSFILYCVDQFKIQKMPFRRGETLFFFHVGKKWNLTFEVTISMFSQSHAGQQLIFQLCHKHFGSSSKMEEEMAALWRHWKLRAHCQRFSLVPP